MGACLQTRYETEADVLIVGGGFMVNTLAALLARVPLYFKKPDLFLTF
jgi:hypothetical protein